MPPAVDVIPRLELSTIKSWNQVVDAVQTQYLAPANRGDLEKPLQDILKHATTADQKLKAIYGFVTQAIRSVPPIVGDLGKIPHPLDYDQILKQGVGDSRDKAALLGALLKKVGVQPQLALISTSGNGTVAENFPSPLAFNRLIVKVDNGGKALWMDPFAENCSFGYLPPEDQGRKAILLETNEFVETPVYLPSANLREMRIEAKLLGDGGLQETLELKADGADGLGMRSVLRNMADPERQQVVASLAAQVANEPHVEAITMSSVDDLNSPMMVGIKFEAKNYATVAGDLTFFSMPVNVLNYLRSILDQTGPREYPFVLGNTVDEVKRLELVIPKGYRIRTLPKGAKILTTLGSYQASFTASKGKLVFQSTFTLAKTTFSPKEFESLKSLVADKEKVEESKIVLEKTTKPLE